MLALLLLVACSGSEEPEAPVFHAPGAVGPYIAATWQGEVAGDPDLVVQVWYPADSGSEVPYRYDGFIEGTATSYGLPSCESPRPVVVFSHGNTGVRYQSWSLMEYLATHGFVVIAPDHTGNTFTDNDPDNWAAIALRRPEDLQRSFAYVADGPWELGGCVDFDAGYAVIGHSFGGFTTLATAGAPYDMDVLASWCEGSDEVGCDVVDAWFAQHPDGGLDDRSDGLAWAGVPLAPAWADLLGVDAIDVPMMVVGGDRDLATTWEGAVRPVYDGLTTTPRFLLGLENAGHYSFTDFCQVVPTGDGCGDDYRPVEDVQATMKTAVTSFLRGVLGDDEAWATVRPAEGVSVWEQVD
jgi:predicted dienelactone hydrolase